MVLLAPYLPRLFEILDLSRGDRFIDHAAAERAVYLLQFAVTGDPDVPEYELALNKLLCGVAFERPLTATVEISATGREAVQSLLEAVIGHWSTLGNTSVAGFRESFLQRKGILQDSDQRGRLRVEERGYDVLLDRIPWSFRSISYPWMSGVLQVEWR